MRDAVDTREGGARSIPAEQDPGRFGRRVIFLLAALTLLIGWGYGLWRIADDRKLTLEASHQQLATLARALSSQFEAMVADGVGSALAAERLLRAGAGNADTLDMLSGMLNGGSYVRSLFLLRGEALTVANLPGEALGRGRHALAGADARLAGRYLGGWGAVAAAGRRTADPHRAPCRE